MKRVVLLREGRVRFDGPLAEGLSPAHLVAAATTTGWHALAPYPMTGSRATHAPMTGKPIGIAQAA